MGICRPGPHNHIVTIAQLGQHPTDVFWIVLAIGIHEQQDGSAGLSCAGFDGGAVTHRVRMIEAFGTMLPTDVGGIIRAAIIHDDDLGVREGGAQFREQQREAFRLVFRGKYDAEFFREQ